MIEFGYFPDPLNITTKKVSISCLPFREAAKAEVAALSQRIKDSWIYPPQLGVEIPGTGEFKADPFPTRIFCLPRTHQITHTEPDSEDHLAFHLWSLSFFTGMRLTATDAGFVDATPIRPNTLTDFVLLGESLSASVELAEKFWCSNRNKPVQPKRFAAAIHALFLAQYPQALQFERFIYLYTALDACYKLANEQNSEINSTFHSGRVEALCEAFKIPLPDWANDKKDETLADIRNNTFHEGLYMGEPLGFALHGVNTNQNLTLEMQALICRLLVAIIGADFAEYVRSPVNTRQTHGLKLT